MPRLTSQKAGVALRKITGGYHGSNKAKLEFIAGVEPLQIFLDDLSATWAARSLRTGDKLLRNLVDERPAPGATGWYDATGQDGTRTDCEVASAFYMADIPSPESRSYSDRDSVDLLGITPLPLMQPEEERSKHKGYWAGSIGGLIEQGWNIQYTDWTGRKEVAAAAHFSEKEEKKGMYLGHKATAADAEESA